MDTGVAVAVVGPEAEAVAGRVREAGLEAAAATPATAADGDGVAVVTVGQAALVAVARLRPERPVLPVEGGAGVGSVPRDRLGGAVEALAAEEFRIGRRELFSARTPDRETPVLFDATLAADPASISEYTVRGVLDAEEAVLERVRADGVVVATPAGSVGYARSAGGPLAAPGTGVAVVVPIGPYAVERDRWVLAPPVGLAVERDEGAVSLFADGREVGPVGPGDPVEVTGGDSLRVAVVPGADPPVPTHKT